MSLRLLLKTENNLKWAKQHNKALFKGKSSPYELKVPTTPISQASQQGGMSRPNLISSILRFHSEEHNNNSIIRHKNFCPSDHLAHSG